MKVILFDEAESWQHLLPLTYTRPIAELRVGILTIREKWQNHLNAEDVYYQTEAYLQEKYTFGDAPLWINSSVCPTPELAARVASLKPDEMIFEGNRVIAANISSGKLDHNDPRPAVKHSWEGALFIDRTWKIFLHVADEIKKDFSMITAGRESAPLEDPHTVVYGRENLFLEPGARVMASVIDATNGPVYLGRDSFVSAGSVLREAFSLGE